VTAPAQESKCTCEFADIGIGMLKVAETPDCPECTEFGRALVLASEGTPAERKAAAAYLDHLLDPPAESRLSTPGDWQEWLCAPVESGARALLIDGDQAVPVPETNWMAGAKLGETTGGYRRTGRVQDGMVVWEREKR
jgi:hypothetical protein